jgi:hypothetical protein
MNQILTFNTANKISKKILNDNAVKFKLTKLRNVEIRYEVIYKNLVRDMRKFYSVEFNEMTGYINNKRRNNGEYF